MKKYLLPLILILFLTFTLIGDCWVDGYDQRIKLTTDHTKIDDTLSDFPVTAFFTDAQAEEIFAEFDADEDFDRGQFALEDDTLLYAEKELFDDSESLAIYHFKVSSISSSEGTDIYFYYDDDAGHNTDYIGAINTVAGAAVWDSNFKFVGHMVDDTTSTILDSTSNNNDGTKLDANDPVEAVGKIGQAQDFDGTEDHITIPAINLDDYTIEMWVEPDDLANTRTMISNNIGGSPYFLLRFNAGGTGAFFSVKDNEGDYMEGGFSHGSSINTFYYIVLVVNGTTSKVYIDTVEKITRTNASYGSATFSTNTYIGTDNRLQLWFDGIEDEVRISNTNRSLAWMKGTYNSGKDTLFNYGSEETEEVAVDNAIFFGANF